MTPFRGYGRLQVVLLCFHKLFLVEMMMLITLQKQSGSMMMMVVRIDANRAGALNFT